MYIFSSHISLTDVLLINELYTTRAHRLFDYKIELHKRTKHITKARKIYTVSFNNKKKGCYIHMNQSNIILV